MATEKPHLLIVEARFYEGLSEALLEGATAALEEVMPETTVPTATASRLRRRPVRNAEDSVIIDSLILGAI